MKKTGSERHSANGSSAENAESVEIIDRARLQADVAQQRVRLAKDELHRARKRLKEAKREAKRARKYASLARKDWKRARRQAEKHGSVESHPDMGLAAKEKSRPRTKATPTRSRRIAVQRTRRRRRPKAGK